MLAYCPIVRMVSHMVSSVNSASKSIALRMAFLSSLNASPAWPTFRANTNPQGRCLAVHVLYLAASFLLDAGLHMAVRMVILRT